MSHLSLSLNFRYFLVLFVFLHLSSLSHVFSFLQISLVSHILLSPFFNTQSFHLSSPQASSLLIFVQELCGRSSWNKPSRSGGKGTQTDGELERKKLATERPEQKKVFHSLSCVANGFRVWTPQPGAHSPPAPKSFCHCIFHLVVRLLRHVSQGTAS